VNARAELAKMWEVLPRGADSPIHLRALWPKGVQGSMPPHNLILTPAEYPNVLDRTDAFADIALHLNAEGYNIYTCLNPILPGHTSGKVRDRHIAFRARILIDIDRVETLETSATDAEIAAAERLADTVTHWFVQERGVSVFRVMSGNGVHLYVPLDQVANDVASKHRCMRLLRWLATSFGAECVKIDTTVFNASRITKVPGTIMRKGLETPDRPYRMAYVV
jgi:hypothetical protein